MENVDKTRDAKPNVDIYIYEDAGHGFICDHRASYHEERHPTEPRTHTSVFRRPFGLAFGRDPDHNILLSWQPQEITFNLFVKTFVPMSSMA